jgi:hypothetical protein
MRRYLQRGSDEVRSNLLQAVVAGDGDMEFSGRRFLFSC